MRLERFFGKLTKSAGVGSTTREAPPGSSMTTDFCVSQMGSSSVGCRELMGALAGPHVELTSALC